jgi:mannose-6-phosphate isomerase
MFRLAGMSAIRLTTRRVTKPWGRRDLLPGFRTVGKKAKPVGEIWFEDPRGSEPALLVKYLFTSEKLSIQVHPDDAAAHSAGLRSGKDEAWVVLEADAGATIGLGLTEPVETEALRAAAVDGRIEAMVDWRPAAAGDTYYSPAGTIHSLGAGLKLVEVQQNVDATYRLYDFGRPRELHLDQALAVASAAPYRRPFEPYEKEQGRTILAEGGKFVLERWTGARSATLEAAPDAPFWLIPLAGRCRVGGSELEPGTVWLVDGRDEFMADEGADLPVAYR